MFRPLPLQIVILIVQFYPIQERAIRTKGTGATSVKEVSNSSNSSSTKNECETLSNARGIQADGSSCSCPIRSAALSRAIRTKGTGAAATRQINNSSTSIIENCDTQTNPQIANTNITTFQDGTNVIEARKGWDGSVKGILACVKIPLN